MMRKLFKKKDEGKIDTRAWKAHLKCVFSTVFYDFFFFLYFLFSLYMRRESIMLYPTAQQCVEPDQRERSIILFKCHEIKAISQFFKHLWILLAFYMRWTDYRLYFYVCVCFFFKGQCPQPSKCLWKYFNARGFPKFLRFVSNVDFNFHNLKYHTFMPNCQQFNINARLAKYTHMMSVI